MAQPSPEIRQRLAQLKAEAMIRAERDAQRQRAILNAEKASGQPVALPTDKKAEGGLAEFLKDSAVKHRVYHGTADDFSEFQYHPERAIGIWLAKNPDVASGYSDIAKRTGKNPSIMPLHVSLKNPASRAEYLAARKIAEAHSDKHGYADHNKRHREILQSQGFDGVDLGDAYIAFHPHQIKSAIGNRGTYNPKDPDITKAKGGSIPSQDMMRLAIGGQGPRNFLKGSVEQVIDPLKINAREHTPENEAELQKELQEAQAKGDQGWLNAVQSDIRGMKHGNAINQWIERNLGNYIKKQMATHDDPIRKLAEQGIIHMPTEQVGMNRYNAHPHRAHMDGTKLAESPEAEAWEDSADIAIGRTKVKNIPDHQREPWMDKVDPETHLYYPRDEMHAHYLGFDHIVDILKQDLAEGRIRPEQLSKVSIEQAVRRVHEYDQAQKKKMAETALKATEGMPVHKEYPTGHKWIELTLPKELPEGYSQSPSGTYVDPQGKESIHHPNYGKLEDALKYEGDTMGHCVGGYTPDVAAGKSRIFSLRDEKNEPHVTVEVKPRTVIEGIRNLSNAERQALAQEIKDKHFGGVMPGVRDEDKYFNLIDQAYVEKYGEPPPKIQQIKGKGNAKPKKDYIPFVQDFVKSGNWSEVGDLKNTDLIKHEGKYLTPDEHSDWLLNQLKPDQMADGGEVDAESVFMGKGGLAKFLKDSVVKDRMYHATSHDFSKFADNPRGVHFVTPSPKWAHKFLSQDGGMPQYASIMPVHVSAKNPFDYQNKKHVNALSTKASLGKLGVDQIKKGDWSRIEDRTTLQAIKDLGHDGVYVKENGVKNLGVFHPHQIKSAIGNRGTYDINDPDITKAEGGEVNAESAFFPKSKE